MRSYNNYAIVPVNANEFAIINKKSGALSEKRWPTHKEAGIFLARWWADQKSDAEKQAATKHQRSKPVPAQYRPRTQRVAAPVLSKHELQSVLFMALDAVQHADAELQSGVDYDQDELRELEILRSIASKLKAYAPANA